jgi:hypothetical protein
MYRLLLHAQQENKDAANNNNNKTCLIRENYKSNATHNLQNGLNQMLHTTCKMDLAIPRVRGLLLMLIVVIKSLSRDSVA